MYCERLQQTDKSTEFVPYAENAVFLWNSGGAFGNQYPPYHEQYAVSRDFKEA